MVDAKSNDARSPHRRFFLGDLFENLQNFIAVLALLFRHDGVQECGDTRVVLLGFWLCHDEKRLELVRVEECSRFVHR